jgi:DNA-binding transcriptional MerR regulator
MIRGHLTIADVSRQSGLSEQTLRQLEARKLIPQARRDAFSGKRVYSQEEINNLCAIIAGLARERQAQRDEARRRRFASSH